LFVYPANPDVALPQSFIDYAPEITKSFSLLPDEIAKNRQSWTDQWTAIVLK
jgi:thiamine transport system substrate-binding protein